MNQGILHLRASNFVGGPEKQILDYAAIDFDGQVEVCVGSFCGDHEGVDLLRAAESRGIGTVSLPADSLIGSLRAVLRTTRQSNLRLLCAHGFKPAVLSAIVSRLTGVPYVCFLRGWTKENRKVSFYESLERFCARGSNAVVCLSKTQASGVEQWVRGSRVRVVVNAAKVRNYTSQQRDELKRQICALAAFDAARPLVVAAGRLSPEKGTSDLIRAAKEVQRGADVQFAIFGEGVERKNLKQQISCLGLDGSVRLVGHQANFADLVAGADLLVNPSLTEQMPNVVLEAMSAGVPVVATSVGGVPELGEGGAIALVQPGDTDALGKTITDVIHSKSRCRTMVQAAQERLQQDFSPEKQAEQLKSLYREFLVVARTGSSPSLARISVVVPIRNEERHIAAVLEALRSQDYPSELFEVIVVDGMSTDSTAEVVRHHASRPGVPVRLVQNLRRLSSSGRNVGVANANGDIIVFVDGHCHIPDRNLLRNVSRLFGNTGADILCRPQPLDFPTNSFVQRAIAAARASWLGHGRDSTIYSTTREGWVDPSSAGAIYRRSLFDRFGGFDESFDACEDVEFNYRLHHSGARAYISPQLTILYEPRKNLMSLFNQMVRYGTGRVRLARKHAQPVSLSQLAPAMLVFLAGIGLVLAFTHFRYLVIYAGAIYAAIVFLVCIRISNRIGIASLPMLPLVFATVHFGLGCGLIAEWVTGQSHLRSGISDHVHQPDITEREVETTNETLCSDE